MISSREDNILFRFKNEVRALSDDILLLARKISKLNCVRTTTHEQVDL
jgi:hypothetical protein